MNIRSFSCSRIQLLLNGGSSEVRYNETLKPLRRQLTKSLINDQEQWRIEKREEIVTFSVIANMDILCRLLRNTRTPRSRLSEMIRKPNAPPIHFQQSQLERWIQHFRQQLSLSTDKANFQLMLAMETMQTYTSPLTRSVT